MSDATLFLSTHKYLYLYIYRDLPITGVSVDESVGLHFTVSDH